MERAIIAGLNLEGQAARQLGALELAYLGDAVYELYARGRLLRAGGARVNRLHQRAIMMVNAASQAAAFRRVARMLTPEELDVARRGRNAQHASMPRNQSADDYHAATALETLIGYLALTADYPRLDELMDVALDSEDQTD